MHHGIVTTPPLASISLELLINFPIAIKCTCYKIGGYAYNNKRRNLHNISVNLHKYCGDIGKMQKRRSLIDLSVHTISLNGMIDQKNLANRIACIRAPDRFSAKIEIANQMAGI